MTGVQTCALPIFDEVTVVAPGINGKMSEVNAAFGLLQLKNVSTAMARRKEVDARYREAFAGVKGIRCLETAREGEGNYSYFPILVEPDYPMSRDVLYEKMRAQGVYGRRYFYPLISDFPMYRSLASSHRDNLPVATAVAQKVICLPMHPALGAEDQGRVISIIRGS